MSDVEQATEEEIEIDDGVKPVKNQSIPGKFCINTILKVIFSTPGLVILVIFYSIMGALIFPLLEAPREVRNVAAIAKSREDCLKELWTITEKLNVLYEKNWTMLVHEQLRRFEGSIVAATRNGVNAVGSDRSPRWSFSEALLYSVTVITTIGHGNLAPKTSSGKVVTILYALIGVPLMLMCLSSLGGLLADALQCTYTRLCCGRKRDSNEPDNICTTQSYEMNCNLCKYDAVCTETKLHPYEYAAVNDREDSCRLIHNSPSKTSQNTACIQLKSNPITKQFENSSPLKLLSQQSPQHQQSQQYSPIHHNYHRSGITCRGNTTDSGLELTVSGTTYYPTTQTPTTNNHFTCNSTGIFNHPANVKYHGLQLHSQLQHNKGFGVHPDHHSSHTATVHGIRRGKFLPKPMPQEINMLLAESDMSYHHETSTNSSGNVDIMADEEEENELNRIGCPHGTPSRVPLISSSGNKNLIGMEIVEQDDCNRDDEKKIISTGKKTINHIKHNNCNGINGNVVPQVPIIIVLIILISYIGIGTVIFSLWENWSFIDGAYFCFVTLSTIGYGDFLPKQTINGPDLQLFACCAYLLLGLVLVAMSFSLLETQLMWKCKQIAVRLKLAKD